MLKAYSTALALLRGGGNFKRLGLVEASKVTEGVSLKWILGPFLLSLFASQPPWSKQLPLPCASQYAVLPYTGPKARANQPQTETSATMNHNKSFLLRVDYLWICDSHRKLTNTTTSGSVNTCTDGHTRTIMLNTSLVTGSSLPARIPVSRYPPLRLGGQAFEPCINRVQRIWMASREGGKAWSRQLRGGFDGSSQTLRGWMPWSWSGLPDTDFTDTLRL